ncbi:hypothetical protein LJC68_10360 [Bacteroidales bacterium OttesenSCG-928-B11]|nr:hypothetical protein [Bacteroidales bacterium OttesenSCG-928-B11]
MSNQKIDNVVDATSYLLKNLGVKFTENYLSNKLQTHPFYPSLAAVSEALTSYHIESEAYRVSYADLLTWETPFIAHLTIDNNIFVVVEMVTEEEVLFYYGDKHLKSIKKEDFIKIWDNIVFLAKPSPASGEPDYATHRQKNRIEKAKIPVMVSLISIVRLHFPRI